MKITSNFTLKFNMTNAYHTISTKKLNDGESIFCQKNAAKIRSPALNEFQNTLT